MQGLLLFYKPVDWRNKDILKFFQNTFGRDIKVGHSGTLDPFADGLMVMGLGRKFTKQLHDLLLNSKKEYIAKIEFGKTSDTFDVEGEIKELENKIEPSADEIKNTIERDFIGERAQVPPIFSAKKHKGKRLRDIAGNADIKEIVKSKTKNVILYDFEIISYKYPFLEIRLSVSSGFYIRSFGNDLGEKLNAGAYTKELKRIKLGDFSVDNALSPDDFQNTVELKGKIFGNVQGVGFRYFIEENSVRLNLKGFVKNSEDSSVEFLVQGNLNDTKEFQSLIKSGPSLAKISDYEFLIQKPKKIYKVFEIAL